MWKRNAPAGLIGLGQERTGGQLGWLNYKYYNRPHPFIQRAPVFAIMTPQARRDDGCIPSNCGTNDSLRDAPSVVQQNEFCKCFTKKCSVQSENASWQHGQTFACFSFYSSLLIFFHEFEPSLSPPWQRMCSIRLCLCVASSVRGDFQPNTFLFLAPKPYFLNTSLHTEDSRLLCFVISLKRQYFDRISATEMHVSELQLIQRWWRWDRVLSWPSGFCLVCLAGTLKQCRIITIWTSVLFKGPLKPTSTILSHTHFVVVCFFFCFAGKAQCFFLHPFQWTVSKRRRLLFYRLMLSFPN